MVRISKGAGHSLLPTEAEDLVADHNLSTKVELPWWGTPTQYQGTRTNPAVPTFKHQGCPSCQEGSQVQTMSRGCSGTEYAGWTPGQACGKQR